MHSIWQDVRYGLRGLRKQPGFAFLAALTLGLGIGGATTIFSVIQNVLLDPYPYANVDRNVTLEIRDASRADRPGRSSFRLPEFLDYQAQLHSYEDVIAGAGEDVLYTTAQGTEQFFGGLTSGNTFTFLGLPAAIGRTLTPDDSKPGAPPVFVLSYKTWVGRFGADPAIVGRTFTLNGVPRTLVGVMPARFTKMAAEMYLPASLDRGDAENSRRYFRFQARLKPGVTLEQAESEFAVVAKRLAAVYPKDYPEQFVVKVATWVDSTVGQFKNTLYTLAAAVGLLLLIACSNVANMLLTRGTAREREMAVRASLGASRGRLVMQLLVESLLLALFGAGIGALCAYFGLKSLVAAIPEGLIPRESVISLNRTVLLFCLAIAAVTSVVCGLLPALRTARADLVEPLKDAGKGSSGGFRGRRVNAVLVVGEVALSLVLLAGAGLLMRSFIKLQTVDLGMRPEGVLHARVPLPRGQYTSADAKRQFFTQVLSRVRALPGVTAATLVTALPPYGGIRLEVDVPGRMHDKRWDAIYNLCSEGYFDTLGVRMLRGRLLSETDVQSARKVAVVNKTLADRFFGDEDPIGRSIDLKGFGTIPDAHIANTMYEIVGMVADVRNQGVQEPPVPEMFIPYTVTGAFDRGVLVKTAGNPLALVNGVRHEIWEVDRRVAVTMTGSLPDYLTQFSYAEPRFSLVILAIFATTGLVLVALGVFSVIAYTVARHTHEIGIRIALGAARGDVMRMVLWLGARLAGGGILIGIAASLAVTRVLASQLFGVEPNDPITFGGVVLVVAASSLVACYLPARRATAVDPMEALRHE